MSFIIIEGNPRDGYAFCGPFPEEKDALEYINDNTLGVLLDCYVADLVTPTYPPDRYQKHWVDTRTDRLLTFDEVERLGLDGTLRS